MGNILFGSSKTSTEKMPLLTSAQISNLDSLSNYLKSQIGLAGPQYGGKFTPGITPLAKEWIAGLKSMPDDQLWRGATDTLMGAMRPYDKTAAMDYWSNAIKTPALEDFEDTMKDIATTYGGLGAIDSGAFINAQADAAKDLHTDLNATLAKVLFSDKNAYEDRAMRASDMGANMAQTLANILQAPAAFEYNDLANDLQMRYMDWLQSLPNSQLAKLAGLFGTSLGTRAFENVITQRHTPGILGDILKAGSQLGSAAIMYW